jgi:hypothetical protein
MRQQVPSLCRLCRASHGRKPIQIGRFGFLLGTLLAACPTLLRDCLDNGSRTVWANHSLLRTGQEQPLILRRTPSLMHGHCTSANTFNDALYQGLFNFKRDLEPIATIADTPNVMEVHPSFPATTVPEFIAYAKSNPGKITFASAGIGRPLPGSTADFTKLINDDTKKWAQVVRFAGLKTDWAATLASAQKAALAAVSTGTSAVP